MGESGRKKKGYLLHIRVGGPTEGGTQNGLGTTVGNRTKREEDPEIDLGLPNQPGKNKFERERPKCSY